MSGKPRAAREDDVGDGYAGPGGPLQRAWLYGGHGVPGDHHIKCRDDGHLYHAAHRDLPSAREVDPVEALIRDAGLGMLEGEVFRRQRQGVESNGAIAESMGLTLKQLERAVTSARRKLKALKEKREASR